MIPQKLKKTIIHTSFTSTYNRGLSLITNTDIPPLSAPVPLFVHFVGGSDAESGRPQLSKPKVCELVAFVWAG